MTVWLQEWSFQQSLLDLHEMLRPIFSGVPDGPCLAKVDSKVRLPCLPHPNTHSACLLQTSKMHVLHTMPKWVAVHCLCTLLLLPRSSILHPTVHTGKLNATMPTFRTVQGLSVLGQPTVMQVQLIAYN